MDFNSFWWTISRRNFTSENYKLANLTWIMSPHYLVKRESSCLQCITVIIITYSLHRYITNQVSISPLSTVCLVCKVQLTEVITVFFCIKWVALRRAGSCVVCVVYYSASSIRWVVFHKVVRRHYSGDVSEFVIFLCEF